LGYGEGKMKGIMLLVATTFLASCATVQPSTYYPPTPQSYENTEIFENSKDELWAALVDSASSSFFAINNFEKDSGLMTLDFSGNAEDYVDCGIWTGGGSLTWITYRETNLWALR
jgi:hypothetical protein